MNSRKIPDGVQISPNETARVEAFSDGVFAVAITLLIVDLHVPPRTPHGGLATALVNLWPSYLAFAASFMTIGVMWLNHHRLFTLIVRKDDGLIAINLLLLMGVTWLPFPTGLLAEHLQGPRTDQRTAALMYAGSFFFIALVFNLMWRYAVKVKTVANHADVAGVTRQYALGPLMYAALVIMAYLSAKWALILSAVYAVYFALPPALWRRKKSQPAG
jgi:uncharacterized membrane protein